MESEIEKLKSQLIAKDAEIDKWKNGKFAEFGNDFGTNPITLIQLLRREIAELKKDKERLDWLEKSILDDKCDPIEQFISLKCGPFRDCLTLKMYNGNTTQSYQSQLLRQAIDQARKV